MADVKRIVILPDMHFDSHDRSLVAAITRFLGEYKPDELVCVGDFIDCRAPARWSRATADEFSGTLQRELDVAIAWMDKLRQVYDGPFAIRQGNHDSRIETYLATRGPALASLRALRIEELLELDRLQVTWHRKFIKVAPGWVVTHGHEGALARYAGGTAMNIARKIGKNVVCGHTHRTGIITESVGYGGSVRHLTGMEVGNTIDMRKAHYLPTGSANWQSGLGLLYVTDRYVTPSLVPILPDRSFIVEGQRYH